jgi:5'-nucleotidase
MSGGAYPTIVKNADGDEVPILQSWEWGKVFGHITLEFDANGKLVKWHDAKVIVVDDTIPDDPNIASMIAAFKRPIAALAAQPIGTATVEMPNHSLTGADSPMGDVIADGMLAATAKSGAVAAFVNAGGVRGGLEPGKITYGMLISIEPFGNTLETLDLTGAEVKAAILEGVGTGGQLIPSKGSSYTASPSQQGDARVSDVVINGQPLDLSRTYRITFLNFTANGGDNHVVLKGSTGARTDTGLIDLDALIEYVKAHNPLAPDGPARVSAR